MEKSHNAIGKCDTRACSKRYVS